MLAVPPSPRQLPLSFEEFRAPIEAAHSLLTQYSAAKLDGQVPGDFQDKFDEAVHKVVEDSRERGAQPLLECARASGQEGLVRYLFRVGQNAGMRALKHQAHCRELLKSRAASQRLMGGSLNRGPADEEESARRPHIPALRLAAALLKEFGHLLSDREQLAILAVAGADSGQGRAAVDLGSDPNAVHQCLHRIRTKVRKTGVTEERFLETLRLGSTPPPSLH